MIDAKIFKNAYLFKLKLRCAWGNSGKGQLSDDVIESLIPTGPLGESATEKQKRIDAAKGRMKLGVKLIECQEYDAIKAFQSETKAWLLTVYCNPSFIDDGLYTVKADKLPDVVKAIERAAETLREKTEEFLVVYESRVKEARKLLGPQVGASRFPEVEKLRGAFGIEYRVVKLDIPEGLPPEIRAQEERKLRESFERAEQELIRSLREGFMAILEHITERLGPGPDGKRKRFNDDLFQSFTDFIGSFQNKNVLGDEDLEKLVEQAKVIWRDVANGSASDVKRVGVRVREIEPVRERTLEAMNKVKEALSKTIEDMPSRSFSFDE